MSLDLLKAPAYEAAEASRLVGLDVSQVRRWMRGYQYDYKGQTRCKEPLDIGTGRDRMVSFLDLVELHAAKLFLDHGLSAQKVRRAFQEACGVLGEYPFARHRLYALGQRLFLEVKAPEKQTPNLLELFTGGQWAIVPIVKAFAKQLDFDDDYACAWYPAGKLKPVVVSPAHAFGAPTIQHRNTRTAVIYDFFLAEGRRPESVARWFNLKESEVRAAVEFEERMAAPKAA